MAPHPRRWPGHPAAPGPGAGTAPRRPASASACVRTHPGAPDRPNRRTRPPSHAETRLARPSAPDAATRQLLADLRASGFAEIGSGGGKGSHRKFLHPRYPGAVTVSGKPGDDAKPYQEQQVRRASAHFVTSASMDVGARPAVRASSATAIPPCLQDLDDGIQVILVKASGGPARDPSSAPARRASA